MKTFEFRPLPGDGLHHPDEKHELLIGTREGGNLTTSIKLTPAELAALTGCAAGYLAKHQYDGTARAYEEGYRDALQDAAEAHRTASRDR